MRAGATSMPWFAVGEVLFVVCAACYLVWWARAFRPPVTVPRPVARGFLLGAGLCGAAGVLVLLIASVLLAIQGEPAVIAAFMGAAFGGGVLGAVLVPIMAALHRPTTTELPLIVVWATVQGASWAALAAAGPAGGVLPLLLLVGATVVALVCYAVFYRLPPVPAYWAGMIPLFATGLASAALAAVLIGA